MQWLAVIPLCIIGIALLWWWFKPVPVARTEGPISTWVIPDAWAVGRGTHENKPIITRFNKGLRAVAGNPAFPIQIGIAVPFRNPREDGFPPSEEMAELNEIEDQIGRRFCAQNESLFAGVMTTGGMREFVLYTSNESASIEKRHKLAEDITHHEIQFVLIHDPSWDVFKAFTAK